MVQVKEHIEKFEKDKKPWARVVKWILGIFATIFLIGVFLTQGALSEPMEKPSVPKYEVRVSNSIGGHTYLCEYYTQESNTYKLFNSDSTLTNEITITDGYVVEIKLSE